MTRSRWRGRFEGGARKVRDIVQKTTGVSPGPVPRSLHLRFGCQTVADERLAARAGGPQRRRRFRPDQEGGPTSRTQPHPRCVQRNIGLAYPKESAFSQWEELRPWGTESLQFISSQRRDVPGGQPRRDFLLREPRPRPGLLRSAVGTRWSQTPVTRDS